MYEVPVSFFQKVETDYAAYLSKWQDKPFSEVLPHIVEISHMVKLHRGLYAPGYPFQSERVAYLNQFAHPLDILLAHREEYYFDDAEEDLNHIFRNAYEDDYANERGFSLDAESPQGDWYTILSGREQTITPYAAHGVPGFNPVTERWETIDPTAIYYLRMDKYDVDPQSATGVSTFSTLLCDRDLRSIARQKGLIFE